MSPARQGVFLGLATCVPVVIWTVGQCNLDWREGAAMAATVHGGLVALWIVQLLAASAVMPFWRQRSEWREGFGATLIMVLIPLPLLPFAWLTGAADALPLLQGQLIVWSFWGFGVITLRAIQHRSGVWDRYNLAGITFQISAAALVWRFRGTWLGWAGL